MPAVRDAGGSWVLLDHQESPETLFEPDQAVARVGIDDWAGSAGVSRGDARSARIAAYQDAVDGLMEIGTWPGGDGFQVYADPAGYSFCLCWVRPRPACASTTSRSSESRTLSSHSRCSVQNCGTSTTAARRRRGASCPAGAGTCPPARVIRVRARAGPTPHRATAPTRTAAHRRAHASST